LYKRSWSTSCETITGYIPPSQCSQLELISALPIKMTTTPSWQTLSAAHRERQKRAIPAEWTLEPDRIEQLKHVGTKVEGRLIEADVVRESGLLTDADLAITQDFTAAELLKKMSSRDLTSLQVVEAFGKRAALAQQLASCSSGPLLSNERD
jgi:amidase